MKIYTTSQELEGNTLKLGDTVVFGSLKYEVRDSYLDLLSGSGDNDAIFNLLKIYDKYGYATLLYGYTTKKGLFPSCLDDDFDALTRITLELLKEYERMFNKPKTEEKTIKGQLPDVTGNINLKEIKLKSSYELRPKDEKVYLRIEISEELQKLLVSCSINELTNDSLYLNGHDYTFNRYKVKTNFFRVLGDYRVLLFHEELINNRCLELGFNNIQTSERVLLNMTNNIKTLVNNALKLVIKQKVTFEL